MKQQISKIRPDHISKAEINHLTMMDPESPFGVELEKLLGKLITSNARTLKAVETAHKSVKRTLRCIAQRKAKRGF